MDINRYLHRIGYDGSLEPTAETLRALQVAHLRSVPFENLDISLGRPISLDDVALYDKIVSRRRGGFCYELNGLFALLLDELGFQVTRLSARDAHEDGTFGPEFDHLTLSVVAVDQPEVDWLVDVGWGDTFLEPLRLDREDEQVEGQRAYQLAREDGVIILWQRDTDGRWESQYRFTLQPRDYTEFAPMCVYHQTSPESSFTQKKVCTMATENGRITLRDDRLITTAAGQKREEPVEDEAAYGRLLRDRFGIEL